MANFRKQTPKRRSITRTVKKYSEHKNDLKKDFNNRCGYCNDIDTWKNTWFEIDHFVPKNKLKKISITDYSNLVYSCRACNNSKRSKWPTENESIHNSNDKGFIDPCDDEYGNNFARDDNGKIIYLSKLGKWMYLNLKLYLPQHEIIWNIELLYLMIEELEQIRISNNNVEIKDELLIIYREFKNYIESLLNG
jgi:uncharacterized protein (TIGR02646 family)